MMLLNDFLSASNVVFDRNNYKIHLATTTNESTPLDEFFRGDFEEYQNYQAQRNFSRQFVLSLIDLGYDKWLFVGVYEVLGVEPYGNIFQYNMVLLPNQDSLIGRIIVSYHRNTRASYRIGNSIDSEIIISEILAKPMTISTYPGHNNVRISYDELKTIIDQKEPTWYGALSSIKGIYLITDLSDGKQYVGKADGNNGIWQRWSAYALNGHGGNVELMELINDKGEKHKRFFQYSILEIADFSIDDSNINARESHWKEVLGSRKFGLNMN